MNGTGKQSPAEPQDAKRLRQIAEAVEKNAPEWLLSSTPVFLRRLADETPPWREKASAEPQGDVVEKVARRNYERARSYFDGQGWPDWEDMHAGIRHGWLRLREAVTGAKARGALYDAHMRYQDVDRKTEEGWAAFALEAVWGVVLAALTPVPSEPDRPTSLGTPGGAQVRRPRVSLRVVKHLRQEGESRPDLVDGPIAALKVYAESKDPDVAEAAQEAITVLTPSEPREEKS